MVSDSFCPPPFFYLLFWYFSSIMLTSIRRACIFITIQNEKPRKGRDFSKCHLSSNLCTLFNQFANEFIVCLCLSLQYRQLCYYFILLRQRFLDQFYLQA